MTNPWLVHVKKVRAQKKNAKKSYKEVLQIAKLTYKRKYSHDKIAPPRKKRKTTTAANAAKAPKACPKVKTTIEVSER